MKRWRLVALLLAWGALPLVAGAESNAELQAEVAEAKGRFNFLTGEN